MDLELHFSNNILRINGDSQEIISDETQQIVDELEYKFVNNQLIFTETSCVEDLQIYSQYPMVFESQVALDNLIIQADSHVKFKQPIFVDNLAINSKGLTQVAKLWQGHDAVICAKDIYLQEARGQELTVKTDLLLTADYLHVNEFTINAKNAVMCRTQAENLIINSKIVCLGKETNVNQQLLINSDNLVIHHKLNFRYFVGNGRLTNLGKLNGHSLQWGGKIKLQSDSATKINTIKHQGEWDEENGSVITVNSLESQSKWFKSSGKWDVNSFELNQDRTPTILTESRLEWNVTLLTVPNLLKMYSQQFRWQNTAIELLTLRVKNFTISTKSDLILNFPIESDKLEIYCQNLIVRHSLTTKELEIESDQLELNQPITFQNATITAASLDKPANLNGLNLIANLKRFNIADLSVSVDRLELTTDNKFDLRTSEFLSFFTGNYLKLNYNGNLLVDSDVKLENLDITVSDQISQAKTSGDRLFELIQSGTCKLKAQQIDLPKLFISASNIHIEADSIQMGGSKGSQRSYSSNWQRLAVGYWTFWNPNGSFLLAKDSLELISRTNLKLDNLHYIQ